MRFSSFDGVKGGLHSGVYLMKISSLFASQGVFFFVQPTLDRLHIAYITGLDMSEGDMKTYKI